MNDLEPKLRLASAEPVQAIVREIAREQRVQDRKREAELGQSLLPYRVGSVPYLNAVPLTRGLENQISFHPPSVLARLLREDKLDAALVSIVEVLQHDRYEILDGVAIASLGEVKSVLLAHRQPIDQIKCVGCDPASLTSVALLRVLLAERGRTPRFEPLPPVGTTDLPDAALLIGDRALDFLLAPHEHEVWDLGAAWYEMTGLPFVYAVWALRRGLDTGPLRRRLREAKEFGLDTLDEIVRTRTEYTPEFRKDYLDWHVHFHLGSDEKRGVARFLSLMDRHGLGPVYEPRFVH